MASKDIGIIMLLAIRVICAGKLVEQDPIASPAHHSCSQRAHFFQPGSTALNMPPTIPGYGFEL
jgi:hypothetical protein